MLNISHNGSHSSGELDAVLDDAPFSRSGRQTPDSAGSGTVRGGGGLSLTPVDQVAYKRVQC